MNTIELFILVGLVVNALLYWRYLSFHWRLTERVQRIEESVLIHLGWHFDERGE